RDEGAKRKRGGHEHALKPRGTVKSIFDDPELVLDHRVEPAIAVRREVADDAFEHRPAEALAVVDPVQLRVLLLRLVGDLVPLGGDALGEDRPFGARREEGTEAHRRGTGDELAKRDDDELPGRDLADRQDEDQRRYQAVVEPEDDLAEPATTVGVSLLHAV